MAVRYITIDADRAGQRLDNFLLTVLKRVPKSRVYRAIRKGEVRVNKSRASAHYRLAVDDCVRVPPLFVPESKEIVSPSVNMQRWMSDCIIFEDEHVIVLNKPAGIPVHAGSSVDYGVQEIIRQLRPHAACVELVHRLDKGTSGCLIIAKKRSVLRAMQQKFRQRMVKKQYMTLVKGVWVGGSRRVEVPLLKKEQSNGNRRVVVDRVNGKHSVSIFSPIKRFKGATLMLVRIETGRTHQIRVHARHLGYPVAGDDKYGCDAFNLKMKTLGLKRMFLHGASIYFENLSPRYPVFGFGVPLESSLDDLIRRLEINS
jgi:23S rRNA pseudouridine955/2504/2580 synthase